MAAGTDQNDYIEIVLSFSKLELFKKNENHLNFYIFLGNTFMTEIKELENHTYQCKFYYHKSSTVFDVNLCLLSINILEQVTNEVKQICFRNFGNISFPLFKLYLANNQKDKITFEKHPVYNHCLDDETKDVPELKSTWNKTLGLCDGYIIFKKMTSNYVDSEIGKIKNLNSFIKRSYIIPWYHNLEQLAPGNYLNKLIESYHVPGFRLLSGTILPFSMNLLWTNRIFCNDFESKHAESGLFLDVIYNLLKSSIYLHPEFDNVNDFFRKCEKFISTDQTDQIALSCIDVIVNVLNIKTASEPYITDTVYVPKLRKEVNIDQLSNVNNIYGCDCEDGCKYAYELKRLICTTDWQKMAITIPNKSDLIRQLEKTLVYVLRSLCGFMNVMYCAEGICHVVMTLMDWNSVSKLIGRQYNGKYNYKPLTFLNNNRILFVETTAYSSPFQILTEDSQNEEFKRITEDASDIVEIELTMNKSIHNSAEVYSLNSVTQTGHNVSTFYKYFTNLMTLELLDIFPNVIDFLPITNRENWGWSLNDFAYRMDSLQLKPRMHISPNMFDLFQKIVDAQLPSYDIYPIDSYIPLNLQNTFKHSEHLMKMLINESLEKSVLLSEKRKNHGLFLGKDHYVRINIYSIDLLTFKILNDLVSFIERIIYAHKDVFTDYDIRIARLYNESEQSLVVNVFLFFNYEMMKNKEKDLNLVQKQSKPKSPRRFGRK